MDHVLAGRYRLLARLGAGGMSVVWRAHDDVLDREVAVKVLAPELAKDPGLPARVRIEARAAARLRHPNVVEVHDYGETENHLPYVVMELVDGRSLSDVLNRGALAWRSAALIGTQVAAALAAAHARGIVHRDVKPSNVMVTSAGVKLVDFGISATVGEADRIGGEVIGTPAYLAPERLHGGPVRPATDVYALGLLLYLMLAGRLPWQASTTTQMLRAHRYLEPAGLPLLAGLPDEVADLVERCLTKDPAKRPGAEEAARVLADAAGLAQPPPLLDGLSGAAEPPAVTTAVLARRRRRRRRRSLVAAAAVGALVTTGSLLWLGARPDNQTVQAAVAPVAAAPDVRCTVGYAIRSAAGGRISTAVTIANTGSGTVDGWHLTFDLPDGQKLVRGWNGGGWAQEGQALNVRGTGLAAGGRVSTGFDASYRDATTLPAQFRLNGTVCSAEMSVAGATVPPTTGATKGTGATKATVARTQSVTASGKSSRTGGSGGANSGSGGANSGSGGASSGSGGASSGSGGASSSSGSASSGKDGGNGKSKGKGNGKGKANGKAKGKGKGKG